MIRSMVWWDGDKGCTFKWFLAHTWGWQRTQFHHEIGFATVSIHLVSDTLLGVLQFIIICLNMQGSALGAVLIKANF